MCRKLLSALLALTMLAASAVCPALASETAVDTYFENGIIYTVDPDDSVQEALAVKDGLIVFVGSAQEGAAYKAGAREVVDLEGGMLLPGMIDGHIHIASPEFFDFTLVSPGNPEETLAPIRAYVDEHPEKEAFFGFGYMASVFEGDEILNGPRKERLDEICPDRPLIVASFDGHAIWLNSVALEALGLTRDTVAPPGGEIVKDEATGELWGTVRDSAMSLVGTPNLEQTKLESALIHYQRRLNSLGFTGIMTLAGNGFSPVPFAGLKSLEEKGELTLRVHGGNIVTSWRSEEDLALLAQQRTQYSEGLVRLTAAKVFTDGVMDNSSALLLAPYANNPTSHGDTGWTQEAMNEAVLAVNQLGLQVHAHAIGDGGVNMAINAMEYAAGSAPEGDYRNAITHLQLVDSGDFARMHALGIVAVAQPYWHFKQPEYWEPVEHVMLGDRAEREYPLKAFLDDGVALAFASDYPVTANPNPFVAIETAVTRNLATPEEYHVPDIEDADDPAYLLGPEQRLTVQEAIRASTMGGAYAMFAEDTVGSLEVGKSADMIVIDRDLLTVNPIHIGDTVVLKTYFQGVLVYDAAEAIDEAA